MPGVPAVDGPPPGRPEPIAPRRRILVDVTPLRQSRDYRCLFAGQAVAYLGSQLTVVAIPYQVYLLTKSSLAVGMIGLVSVVPLITLSLVGGAWADAVDRRKLLIATQIALGLTSAALALNATAARPTLWPVYACAALAAGLAGVDLPTRNAILPNLVRREQFAAASSLGQVLFQVGSVAGPALAGLIIGRVSLPAAYWIDAGTSLAAIAGVLAIAPQPPAGGGTKAGIASIREGLAYLKGRRLLLSTFVIDIAAMVFGMPRALFPALGTGLYGGGATAVGLLYAAPGAGALVGALLTGWVAHVRRQGWAVILSVIAWGAAIAAFGLTSWLPAGLLFLALAGAADVVSAIFRNTILAMAVPDSLRGRLYAVHISVVTSGPRLGDAEAGAVAALTTPRFSVLSGGLACIAGALVVARLIPELARYDAVNTGSAPGGGAAPPSYTRGGEPDHGNGARGGSEPEPWLSSERERPDG